MVQEYLKKHNMPPTLNTKGFQKRMSSWYHETRRPNKSDNPKVTGTKSTEEQIEERRAAAEAHGTLIDLSTEEKPTTKEELRTWLQEYCQGVKKHGEPNTWDVTSVTDMSELFAGLDTFNAPIDQWDTSQVTNMGNMFRNATAFNQPLTFDTSQVTTCLHVLFATAFNQPLTFDTSQVTDMHAMFYDATAFNQPLTFNTSKVTDMRHMFYKATAFNQPLPFDTSAGDDYG